MQESLTYELKDLLSFYIDATEISNRGTVWLNERGIIEGTNHLFAKEINYESQDLVGKMIFEINPHLSLMGWRKLWKKLLLEEEIVTETELLTSTDELYPVKLRWKSIRLGNQQYCCGVSENLITSSRYEDLLNVASEISRIAAWEWDIIHDDFFITPQFNILFNLPQDFNVNRQSFTAFMTQMLSSKSVENLEQKLKIAMKTGETFEMELDLKQRDHLLLSNINLTAKPLLIEGRTVKIYGTIQDLSNLSSRTEELYLAQYCMEYAQECLLWIDKDGKIIYTNQAAALTYDYTKEVFLTKTIFDLVPDYNKENYVKHWEALAEGGMLELEAIHQKKDGSFFPVWLELNFIRYQGKTFNCAFIRDLTDAKEQEENLRLTQLSVDKAQDMIFWVNEDGSFEYVNDIACSILGYTKQEFAQIKLFAISQNISKSNWQKLWNSFEEKRYFDVETNYYTKDNSFFPVSISANLMKYKEKSLCCLFIKDLRSKKALDKQVMLSMSTIERASDMIFWLDEQASIFYANIEASKNLGYSNRELLKNSLFKIAPGRSKKAWPTFYQKIKENKHLVFESLMKRKNGKVFPVEVTLNHILHENKEIISANAKDITERKAKALKLELAYEEINRLKEEAEQENTILKNEIKLEFSFKNIISSSKSYKKVLKKVEQVADSDATVLILGETGTGKELIARAIHQLSERADRAMIKVNCGALPANLIESELFGHEKGAFTGAYQTKKGRFELAHKGTIFLDEIGELPLDLQAKLLRVLQEGEFEKLGGTKTIKVNVRVIAATNRDLEQKVQEKEFREDLFYRLNVFPIYNIPLRERKEDIAPLVRFFVDKYSKKMGKKISEIPQTALKKLQAYNFPGNVRELENIVERSIILSNNERLSFDTALFRTPSKVKETFPSLEEIQKNHIIEALRRTRGRVSGSKGAAVLLNCNDKTLVSRMKRLGIKKTDYLDN